MRVLVGCPTSYHKEYALEQYVNSVKNFTYGNYDVLLVDNSGDDNYFKKIVKERLSVIRGPYFESARERIVASRNILKDYVIHKGYDYFLSLEQDVIPPKDIIEKLIRHDKKVVSGIYFAHNIINGRRLLIPLVYIGIEDGNRLPSMKPITEEMFLSNKLIEVVSCGLGCVLIHRDVLKEVNFRYEQDKDSFDDRWFCIDLYLKGVKIYCDTSVKCKHLILNRKYNWKDIKK